MTASKPIRMTPTMAPAVIRSWVMSMTQCAALRLDKPENEACVRLS